MRQLSRWVLPLFLAFGLVLWVMPSASWAAVSARIAWVQNTVQVRMGSSWVAARGGMSLASGSAVRTGANARAQINYLDGSVVRLGSRTTAVIRQAKSGAKNVKINKGKAWFKVQKRSKGMKVRTPSAVATVMGTEFVVNVEATAGNGPDLTKTDVTVLDGAVNVASEVGDAVNLTAGMATSVVLNQPPAPPVEVNVDQFKQQEELSQDDKMASNNGNNGSDNGNNGSTEGENEGSTTTASDSTASEVGRKVVNAPVSPENATQQVQTQSSPDQPETLSTSPTTGDLEIIIK